MAMRVRSLEGTTLPALILVVRDVLTLIIPQLYQLRPDHIRIPSDDTSLFELLLIQKSKERGLFLHSAEILYQLFSGTPCYASELPV
jgi:hypothetical protein